MMVMVRMSSVKLASVAHPLGREAACCASSPYRRRRGIDALKMAYRRRAGVGVVCEPIINGIANLVKRHQIKYMNTF